MLNCRPQQPPPMIPSRQVVDVLASAVVASTEDDADADADADALAEAVLVLALPVLLPPPLVPELAWALLSERSVGAA